MSVVSTLLDAFRLRAAVFHNAQYCGRWGVDISGTSHTSFHFVARGQCRFRLRSAPDRVLDLSPGDLLVLPHDASHLLGSADCGLEEANQSKSRPLSDGVLPDSVALMCGYFQFDHAGANPVLQALPEYVLLSTADPAHQGLLGPIIAALTHESLNPTEGSAVVINRLAEILFVNLVRRHLLEAGEASPGEASDTPGLAAALGDERIRRVLERIHEQPDRKWSVTELASIGGMSRSAFSDRFKQLSGLAPMEYCTRWRMQQAYRWLADEGISVLEAALRSGYEGESSFSRAFKRVNGVNPSAVRRGGGS